MPDPLDGQAFDKERDRRREGAAKTLGEKGDPMERERRSGMWKRVPSLCDHHTVRCRVISRARARCDTAPPLGVTAGRKIRSERRKLQSVRAVTSHNRRHESELLDTIEMQSLGEQLAALAQELSCRLLVGQLRRGQGRE